MEEHNKILDKYVGHRIRERRKMLGLTQSELAEMLGLSHQQIQRYESGDNTVSMSRALEIARCMNTDLSYFYANAPQERSALHKQDGVIKKDANRPLRILLVEDVSTDELLFRKAVDLSAVPAELHVIQKSENVLDFLTHHNTKYGVARPDIMVLDINMPRLNGLALLKKIKSDQKFGSMPVIMLTNSVRSKDMLDAYANQASGFIQKKSDLIAFYEDISLLLQYWSRTIVLPSAA